MSIRLVGILFFIISFGQNIFAVDFSDLEIKTIFIEKRHNDDIKTEKRLKGAEIDITEVNRYKKQCTEKWGKKFEYSGTVGELNGDYTSQFILCISTGPVEMTHAQKLQKLASYFMSKASSKLMKLYQKTCSLSGDLF